MLAESGCGIQYLGDGAERQLTVSDEQSDQVTCRALGKGVGVEQKAFVVWELRIFDPTISQQVVVYPAVHDADAMNLVRRHDRGTPAASSDRGSRRERRTLFRLR